MLASAKMGIGIDEILEAIVERVPPPTRSRGTAAGASIFDSVYDAFRGVIAYVRVFEGALNGTTVKLMATDSTQRSSRSACSGPSSCRWTVSSPATSATSPQAEDRREVKIGDTFTAAARPAASRLPGYQETSRWCSPASIPCLARTTSCSASAREAAHQRRRLHLRARELGRPRLRLPLRLPRPAPHGDRPGTAAPRVRPGPHRLGTLGRSTR